MQSFFIVLRVHIECPTKVFRRSTTHGDANMREVPGAVLQLLDAGGRVVDLLGGSSGGEHGGCSAHIHRGWDRRCSAAVQAGEHIACGCSA